MDFFKKLSIALSCLFILGCAVNVNDAPVRSIPDYDLEYHIRKFAMLNHYRVAMDLQSEQNEYLLALADLFGSKIDRAEALIIINEALYTSKGDQFTFGNELINSFRQYSVKESIDTTSSAGGEHLKSFR